MSNFDYKKYIYNNPLLQEKLEDNGPEEKAFDNEFDALGAQLATAIKDELQGKEEKLDEIAGVVGIIGYILLSNTVANMLAKFAQKMSKKYNALVDNGEHVLEKEKEIIKNGVNSKN